MIFDSVVDQRKDSREDLGCLRRFRLHEYPLARALEISIALVHVHPPALFFPSGCKWIEEAVCFPPLGEFGYFCGGFGVCHQDRRGTTGV